MAYSVSHTKARPSLVSLTTRHRRRPVLAVLVERPRLTALLEEIADDAQHNGAPLGINERRLRRQGLPLGGPEGLGKLLSANDTGGD